ncbi:divalent metal cation transporter [Lysinibacillus yapensis]|uniref:Divalent metal cation transporter n=1 Tax=Ureibacillus yapensis TaxID=2304605 RepID=A0A396S9B1_9BACL|nr:NRAMP family divalent metal transporter [Lysinibacillus yapensis]RHW37695.1 divalent metal cation transporter [Lysinibacillus yapensis]
MDDIQSSEVSGGGPVKKKVNRSVLLGAAFLMATSSIGPGFLTQTTVFTQQLAASFGFVILISLFLDIVAQMNVWRIIGVSGLRGQEIANKVLPGLGVVLAILIVIGGLAFNIGNVAGAGLGLNAMLGLDPIVGAVISAGVAIFIFLVKEAGKAMDKFAQFAGIVMILLMMFVAIKTAPPVGEAIVRTFAPTEISWFAIVTLVGGTVGGYITFAGGHRLLDAGVKGIESLPEITKSSVAGILATGVMRVALFLAVLGVVSQGLSIDPDNPPASVFQLAAGEIGYRIFGVIMWAAAITSVVGAAYTSVSFIRTFHPSIEKYHNWIIIAFILISTIVFALVGRPVNILVIVGALNALILPLALGTLLIAAYKKNIVGAYKHPLWLTITGAIVVVLMGYLGVVTLIEQLPLLFK